jgi:F-type H+-transporting ATPase subunit c
MIVIAAKLIASGIASIGVIGAGIGIGTIFGSYLIAVSRNPVMKSEMFSIMLLGFALVEATALFALMISFLLLFAF